MGEEERWQRVRQIVREENTKMLEQLIAMLQTKQPKSKIDLVGGIWKGITEEQMEAWRKAYPAVDVDSELARAAAWCISSPNEAPRSAFGKYLNTWLGREQNRRALRVIPTEKKSTPPNLCEWCLKPSTGAVNGRRACDAHFADAMSGPAPKFMPGQIAKPVAGS